MAYDVVQWGQMMCMEPISTMILPKCYKATVNESETITEAQPVCLVRSRGETSEFRVFGLLPVAPHIERS
jgi:hypothetical protein